MLADALVQGAVEFIVGPDADAVGFVRRDVGRIERAIGGTVRRASGLGGAARRGVTGFAIASAREIGAPCHNRGIRRGRRLGRFEWPRRSSAAATPTHLNFSGVALICGQKREVPLPRVLRLR